jgi:multicomponent Na+:H+ antiporter subunit D
MTLAQLLPLPVVLPITGAIAAPIVARLHRRLPLVVGLLTMPASFGVLLAEATQVYRGNGQVLTHFFSNEKPVHGRVLGIAFAADPFGLAFALLTAGIGTLLLLSALSELGELGPKELGGLACLTQLLLAALIGAALTGDSVNLFVWFEVAALSSYGLTGFFLERPIALEAAFKNCVLTSTAGFVVFAGASMLYATSGALNLGQLHLAIGGHPNRAELIAIGMLVAGFATKAGLVPFHAWLPDAHVPVPGAVSALFSGLMVDLGIVGLVRFGLQVFPDVHQLLGLLTGFGIASAVVGALLTLVQDDLKRLLAWDTVSQMGVLIAGFASRVTDGVTGAVYHLVNHGLFKALLFLCAGGVVHATGITRISEMGGLARRMPVLTAGFTVGCVAIAGVPPFNGYASLGLIHKGLEHEPVALALALVAQAVTVAALGRAAYLAFFRRRERPYEHMERMHTGMRISLAVLGAGCLAFGAFASAFISRVGEPAAASLLHPAAYARAALTPGTTALPRLSIDYQYFEASTLLITAGELVAGLLLLVVVLRTEVAARSLTWLRRLHTGSVNDYAAFLAAGLVISTYVLLA